MIEMLQYAELYGMFNRDEVCHDVDLDEAIVARYAVN